ncbi:hypothetical protein QM012_005959 [Aureobasidium pullulans]|uniref:Uncharacterized protein n=1 Tax=Aureobasidium pullulans TaxID=5580 RepID=A0ABR0TSV2_AURPU
MDDAARYMTSLDHRFVSSDIDILTSDHTLCTLLKFVEGDATPFEILTQQIGKTLFLVEKTNPVMNRMYFTRSFQDACTSWPNGVKSLSHQRLIQYNFDGIQCLVRFEADGALDKTDRLMAAALISDLARSDFPTSTHQDSPVLDMNMLASTTANLDSAFSAQPLKRPNTGSSMTDTKVSSTGYHWSQQETMAQFQHIGSSEREYALQRPKSVKPDEPKKSETSPIVQRDRYLEQYPFSQICSLNETESGVAQRYPNLAEGEFRRAIDLYQAAQSLPDLVTRFADITQITLQQAKQCLKSCKNDYEKALCLHATKPRHPGQNVARIFRREESNREALQDTIQAKNRNGVPHSALFTLHCAAEKPASSTLSLSNNQFFRLWVTRIPSVITAYYDISAKVTSITYTDVRFRIRRWENENQATLTKLSALLKDVKNTARQGRKVVLSVEEKYKMEVRKASGTEIVDVLSEYQKRLWLDRARENEEEEEIEDEDDDGNDDGVDAPGVSSGERMDEEDEEEPKGQKVRNYLSDTSSDWEREYGSSDDENVRGDQDKEK